ncbi:MAG: hypothetical protein ABI325_04550 [Ginsengibacter sp.]
MKNVKICIIALFASCTSSDKIVPNMPGTYLIESQTINYDNKDTKYTDLKQLKIYSDHFMMYAELNPRDSVAAFGVASYTSDTSGVTENIIFSASGSTMDSSHPSYLLNIKTTPDGFIQFIPEIMIGGEQSTLTEVFHRVGTEVTSPLDGVWKEVDSYVINGTDTSRYDRIQYKAFYKGYFMFGNSVANSSSVRQAGIGFGTFEPDGDNKINETDLNSSYPFIAGHTFSVEYELSGADHYKQTINNSDGSKGVEFYERLK